MSTDHFMGEYLGSRISTDSLMGKHLVRSMYVLFDLTFHIPVHLYWLLTIIYRRGEAA